MNSSKTVYELFRPRNTRSDIVEYVVVVREDDKTTGYMKKEGECAKRQFSPDTWGLRFVGYMSEKSFNEMIFIDLI